MNNIGATQSRRVDYELEIDKDSQRGYQLKRPCWQFCTFQSIKYKSHILHINADHFPMHTVRLISHLSTNAVVSKAAFIIFSCQRMQANFHIGTLGVGFQTDASCLHSNNFPFNSYLLDFLNLSIYFYNMACENKKDQTVESLKAQLAQLINQFSLSIKYHN